MDANLIYTVLAEWFESKGVDEYVRADFDGEFSLDGNFNLRELAETLARDVDWRAEEAADRTP